MCLTSVFRLPSSDPSVSQRRWVYEYDAVNNIKTLTNNAPIPTSNLMGGSSEYSYFYDELYRLTDATGTFKGTNHEHKYTLGMKYNAVGGNEHKTQTHQRKSTDGDSWKEQKKTIYDLGYVYGNNAQPNTATHIGDKAYTYDPNGNQTGWTHDVSQRRQVM